jgi:pantetheine-phosphate adenylyltransferase
VCPGSFDPVTNGHLDIVERASRLFDEVVVAVGVNRSKSRLFSPEERIAMLEEACAPFANVRVEGFTGLLTTFCAEHDIDAIVKGLRAVSDFDYELQMAQMNASLTDIETVFVPTSPEYSFLASSLVKEVATYGGDVSGLIPAFVNQRLTERLAERRAAAEG